MRLHWARGRDFVETQLGARAQEWLGLDDSGVPVARVIHLQGPRLTERGLATAVALDPDAKLVRLLPPPQEGGDWLALVGGRVVGRAAAPLAAARRAEAAL